MEPLIYYPTFEPPDNSWLKFALIYFDSFKPIIPYNRQHLLSDNFRNILDSTDLVEIYSPNYDESCIATQNAIEEANQIISKPYDRSYLFKNVNILRKWQNPTNWTFELFEEKFSNDWIYFCETHSIGLRTNNGMKLPEELAFLFMTYLAKEIAYTQNAAIVTDNHKFDTFTNYTKMPSIAVNRREKFAKEIISLLLPGDIHNITFDQLINFRSRNRHLISAFNQELTRVQDKIGQGYSEQDFIDSYKNVSKDFFAAILAEGNEVLVIPFTTYILINDPLATSAEYIEKILGSLGIIYSGAYAMHKALKTTETRRYCKKYLTNLGQFR